MSACIWFQMVIVRKGSCECMHLVPDGDSQERILSVHAFGSIW